MSAHIISNITFNANKSKLLCYNVVNGNGEGIVVVDSDKTFMELHLHKHCRLKYYRHSCDLFQLSNRVINDFRVCDSSTLDSRHRTYCMHMGCEI